MSTPFDLRLHIPAPIASTTDDDTFGALGDFGSSGEADDLASTGAGSFSFSTTPSFAPRAVASATSASSADDVTHGVVSSSSGTLTFDNTYASSVTSQFKASIIAAESLITSLFSPIKSVTANVVFQEASNSTSGNALSNGSNGVYVSYSSLLAALPSSDVMPSSEPGGSGASWYLPAAYGRMLGLTTSTPTPDDTVTLNTFYSWTYSQDVIDGLVHELSEGIMGRVGALGATFDAGKSNQTNNVWSTMDLFRYNSSGQLDDTDGRDGDTSYFSSDGGAILSNQGLPQKGAPTLTFNNQYNTAGKDVSPGDSADWTQQQVFGTTGGGETLALDQTELDVMQALGWTVTLQQDFFFIDGAANWETADDWSTGAMPIEPQDAAIGFLNTVDVTLTSKVIVNSIAINADSTLNIAKGAQLTAVYGTTLNTKDVAPTYSGNLGVLNIDPGGTLIVGPADLLGTSFDNQGTLNVGENLGSGGTGSLEFGTVADMLTLSGSGTVNLGGYADQTFSTGDISGDDLVNDDNTIVGGGTIAVITLDNQAGGRIEASQSEGDDLTLNVSGASGFTNEGEFNVESRATMLMGSGGATRTLTNTGSINLGYDGKNNGLTDADLAIGGNFTLSGGGELNFKGAGAGIISNDAGSDTFTNKSSIVAFASGQIGDNGVYGGTENHLTFVNQGNVYADGAGVTLALETAGETIGDGGGVYLIEAENSGTVAIDSPVTTGELYLYGLGHAAPAAGTIEATTGGTVDIAASVTPGLSGAFPEVVAPGQVGVSAGSLVVVQSGGSVAIPIYIDGSSGKTAGGVLTLQSGGTISGAIIFEGVGGVFDDNSSSAATFDVFGGAGTINLAETGDTIDLSNTTGLFDSITGSGETINESDADSSVSGKSETVNFLTGTDDAVDLNSTGGTWDTVNGSGGKVTVNDSLVSVVGGSDTINATAGSVLSLYKTAGDWDAVNGAGVEVILVTAQAAITGGSDAIYANAGSSASLFSTSGDWDAFNGSGDQIVLTTAQAAITGESNTISATAGSSMSLFGTSGDWDAISGSGDQIILSNAQSEITGGSDTISATTGSSMSIFGTSVDWDAINGSSDQIDLTSSKAAITGGSDAISATSGSSMSLFSTGGHWDAINGSSDTIILTSSQASITGGGDTISATAGCSVSLFSTGGVWDTFTGASDQVILTSSQASIVGESNTVSATSGSSISLYSTSGHADLVTGSSDNLDLTSAQAGLTGNGDTIGFAGTNTLVVTGTSENFDFAKLMGLTAIGGFGLSDVVHLSKSDWSSFSALQASGDLKQSGANTLIVLDAADTITLANVTASTLTTAQFAFA